MNLRKYFISSLLAVMAFGQAHAQTQENETFIATGMGDVYIAGHDGYLEAQEAATEVAERKCAPALSKRISEWTLTGPRKLGYSYVVYAEATFRCESQRLQ